MRRCIDTQSARDPDDRCRGAARGECARSMPCLGKGGSDVIEEALRRDMGPGSPRPAAGGERPRRRRRRRTCDRGRPPDSSLTSVLDARGPRCQRPDLGGPVTTRHPRPTPAGLAGWGIRARRLSPPAGRAAPWARRPEAGTARARWGRGCVRRLAGRCKRALQRRIGRTRSVVRRPRAVERPGPATGSRPVVRPTHETMPV